MTDLDEWVLLGDVYPDVEQAYFERLRDWAAVEHTVRKALFDRLASGVLRARPAGFSYQERRYGPPETRLDIAPLSADGCVPIEFWQDFRVAEPATFESAAGDFSFELERGDYTGRTEGHASEVMVNKSGLPIIGSRPTPSQALISSGPPAPAIVAPTEEAKLARGARVQYDPEEALVYLAAYAHLSNDGLSRRGEEHPSINSIADILVDAWAGKDPSEGTRKKLAKKVFMEIQRQKMAENRGGQ